MENNLINPYYLKYNGGYYKPQIAIINTSKYPTVFSNSLLAWNSATSIVKLTETTSGSCIVTSSNYADSWLGYYTPAYSRNVIGKFTIKLNSRLLDSRSNNYKQSVLVHELGHALSLYDNPPESPSIMRYDRNRETLIIPQADDIKGVNAIYSTTAKTISSNENPHYDYTLYDKEDELLDSTEVIVNGKILNIKTETINVNLDNKGKAEYIDYVVAEVLVNETIKGNLATGETIRVKYPANDADDYFTKDNLEVGNDTILFLIDFTDINKNMPYSLVNQKQGVINFVGEKVNNKYKENKDSKHYLFKEKNKKDLIKHINSKKKIK